MRRLVTLRTLVDFKSPFKPHESFYFNFLMERRTIVINIIYR